MRAIKLTALLLCFITGISSAGKTFFPVSKAPGIKMTHGSIDDTSRINNLIRTGFIYISKPSSAIDVIDKVKACIDTANSVCEKKKIEIPPLLNLLQAEYLYKIGDYSVSEEEAKEAIKKAEALKEYEVLAKALLFMGKYNHLTGFYKESMESYKRSISISQEKGLKRIIPKAYDGIASVYNSANDLKGARENLKLRVISALAENDSVNAEGGLLLLGTSYTDKDRHFRLADSILRKCIEISLIRKDTFYTAYASANLGWNYYTVKMYDSSIFFYKKSLTYSIPGRQYGTSGNSYGNLGTIYRDLGDYDRALKFYDKSLEQAKIANDWYGLSWVYNDMSQLYLNKKDTSEAFKAFVLYKKFNDSLLLSRSNQGLADARIRYEADTHNKEMALLSLRLKNNRNLNIGFAGLIILTITIALLLLRSAKLDARRRISEMNHTISEITQANLRQQMNPHFIFNTLNSIQYYMYQHDKLATNNYLTKFSNLMRKVLENSQHPSVPLHDELDALTLYLDLECLRFKEKFSYEIKIDEEVDPLLFKVPTMLIQPYVENSICHGLMPMEGKGLVKIDIKLAKDHLVCTIDDNGIGREAAQERNKKKNGTNHNSLGTRIVTSRLDLVNALYGTSLKTIYTDLKNEKGEPEGTRVEIHIPILT
jgi:tetratricopeptide (TPR) repeat protein